MSKKTGVVVATLVGLCAMGVFLSCGNSSSRPQGLLYVISDSTTVNNISSYTINLNNGNLSLVNMNASTCTNAAGCGPSNGILLDPTKKVVFVLNEGVPGASPAIPPTVYAYNVNGDGSLGNGTVAATLNSLTGGSALAMAPDTGGDLLFVLVVGPNATPTDCLGTGNNGPDCPQIVVFQTSPGSTTVTPASTFSLSRVPTALSAITFTPPAPNNTQETLLFVTSSQDLTSAHRDNEVSVYAVDSSGTVFEQGNSPYDTPEAPQVVQAVNTNAPTVTTGGVFAYVGMQENNTGTVAAFQVCTEVTQPNCSPSSVSGNQLNSIGTPAGAGNGPIAMLVDPTNNFLYVASKTSSQVFGFQIATGAGTLTALSTASQPTGAQPQALALHPNFDNSAEFLFTSNYTGNSITGFTIGPTTGILSDPVTTLFPPGLPSAIASK